MLSLPGEKTDCKEPTLPTAARDPREAAVVLVVSMP